VLQAERAVDVLEDRGQRRCQVGLLARGLEIDKLVLREALQMKPGREVEPYLDALFTEILGTPG
jgi:hypothetical protein